MAARKKCKDGRLSHEDANKEDAGDRVKYYGHFNDTVGESIFASENIDSATDVVAQMFVDYGVEDLGHRKAILSSKYTVIGISACPNFEKKEMVVFVYGTDFTAYDSTKAGIVEQADLPFIAHKES